MVALVILLELVCIAISGYSIYKQMTLPAEKAVWWFIPSFICGAILITIAVLANSGS